MDESPLTPERVAAAVAPIIDRLRIAISRRIFAASADLLTELQTSDAALGTLAAMRHTLPGGEAPAEQLDETFVYQDGRIEVRAELVKAGLTELRGTSVHVTAAGFDALHRLLGISDRVTTELWATHADTVDRLGPLVEQALSAAVTSGGGALALMTPVYDAPTATPASRLGERLSALRHHRFDAHVAAWRTAGLDVVGVRALAPGPERDAIEADTNRRAAPPWAALSAYERMDLLAGLGALPN